MRACLPCLEAEKEKREQPAGHPPTGAKRDWFAAANPNVGSNQAIMILTRTIDALTPLLVGRSKAATTKAPRIWNPILGKPTRPQVRLGRKGTPCQAVPNFRKRLGRIAARLALSARFRAGEVCHLLPQATNPSARDSSLPGHSGSAGMPFPISL
jgi:hypothetical protein